MEGDINAKLEHMGVVLTIVRHTFFTIVILLGNFIILFQKSFSFALVTSGKIKQISACFQASGTLELGGN